MVPPLSRSSRKSAAMRTTHPRDDESWDEPDFDGPDDDSDTVPCPYCGAEMYEDAPRCPQCGQYISAEDAPAGRKPAWIIVGVLLCLAVALAWIVLSWN
jgi:hypothetical protein